MFTIAAAVVSCPCWSGYSKEKSITVTYLVTKGTSLMNSIGTVECGKHDGGICEVFFYIISSPEHEVLMVSYCDQSMSVVRRPSSTICLKANSS